MDCPLPYNQAVSLVAHWFSQWNDCQREVFVLGLNGLEQCVYDNPIETLPSAIDNSLTDAYLANLMQSNLQMPSATCMDYDSPTVFECQLRLFRRWYPEWPLEQRIQLADRLKEFQLRSLCGIDSTSSYNVTS